MKSNAPPKLFLRFSFINIGGLVMGMAVTILISLWIYDELEFNKYHKNHNSMLSRYFLVLVIIACVISIPIAYCFMNNWLDGYNYRTNVSWLIFAATFIGAVTVTLLTVSYLAISAALMNPVKG